MAEIRLKNLIFCGPNPIAEKLYLTESCSKTAVSIRIKNQVVPGEMADQLVLEFPRVEPAVKTGYFA